MVSDIETKLDFRKGRLFKSSFMRPHLSYSVFNEEDKQGKLLRIIRSVGGSGIVYVRNRRRTLEIANMLNDHDIAALPYHAGIPQKERENRQKDWLKSNRGVMVATNAFGMGIDKPDVRFVVHWDMPESPEAYFQEAGRAGRDDKQAYAVLLYQDNDITRMRDNLERDFPPLNYIKNVYNALCNYYQIPTGSGKDARFEFDAERICNSYSLDIYTFFSALKFLEREGLISLPEHNELQSKLFIIIDKEELYRYQLSNRTIGDMLTVILRLYGGLFTDYTPISESLIASRCGMTETQVANSLKELNRLQIADYQPKMLKPPIVFCSPRIDIRDLHISDKNYKELKEAAWQRRKAMIDYATNDSECRCRQLLRYFGESDASDCGICDVCLDRKKANTAVPEEAIVKELKSGPLTIKQLAERLPKIGDELLAETVRQMLDKGELTMNQDFAISCCSSQ